MIDDAAQKAAEPKPPGSRARLRWLPESSGTQLLLTLVAGLPLACSHLEQQEPAAPALDCWARGVPIPVAARPRVDLGAATTVAPGHNSTLEVYEHPMSPAVATSFYARHLGPAARSSVDANGRHEFKMPGLRIRLVTIAGGTRIEILRSGQ